MFCSTSLLRRGNDAYFVLSFSPDATSNRTERLDDGALATEPAGGPPTSSFDGTLRSFGLRSASGNELAPLFSYKGMMSEASLQLR
jgi:hypothetical protein